MHTAEWRRIVNRKRLILMSVFGATAILIGAFVRSTILSVTHPKPWKVGAVSIPKEQMKISLYFGSMRTAFIEPYNGVYRILEVSQTNKPPVYYDISSLITDDRCRIETYWYPSNNLVRFKDTELSWFAQQFRSEHLLDLNQNVMFAVIRGNGVTHIAKLSLPRQELALPDSPNEDRVAHTYVGDVRHLARNSSESVTIGREDSKPTDSPWTTNSGEFVGALIPKQK